MKNVLVNFNNTYLNETSIVTSKKEAKYYGKYFDYIYNDEFANENSYEEGEQEYLKTSLAILFKKSGNYHPNIIFGGDLTNQLSTTNQVGMQLDASLIGIYAACATLILSMILGGIFVSSNIVENALCYTSSNYGTSERQFRYPLNYGVQKKDSTTITTTGGVSCYISTDKSRIKLKNATIGKIEDISWNDASNMGCPMAYAAYKSINAHLLLTNTNVNDYDLILTGDLSKKGSEVLKELFKFEGVNLVNHHDCGSMIFGDDKNFFSGGSGCACIGIIALSYIKKEMEEGKYKRVLLVGTGSLHSKTSSDQKEVIPLVAHVLELEVVNDIY